MGIAGCTMREISRHLWPYIFTMLGVSLVIALVPWISYAVPVAMGMYQAPR